MVACASWIVMRSVDRKPKRISCTGIAGFQFLAVAVSGLRVRLGVDQPRLDFPEVGRPANKPLIRPFAYASAAARLCWRLLWYSCYP